MSFTPIAGLLVIAAAVVAVARRGDVRLVLALAALALGALAANPQAVVRTFLTTFSSEQFVVPICSAMGFAYVLRQTGCDQHLVRLLVGPVRRVRPVLVPGAVLVGFVVNVPIISQTSTAVAVGPVLLPLLRSAGLSPATGGAALLLGSSLGGELLNPGAPEFQTIARATGADPRDCVRRIVPLLLTYLAAATAAFWWLTTRAEAAMPPAPPGATTEPKDEPPFRVSFLKAAVPLVPLLLLFVTGPPLELLQVDPRWLVGEADPARARNTRLIALAMLVGVAAAALAARSAAGIARAFFEGAGYAFTHIISLIVCAAAFGEGVRLVGLADLLAAALRAAPDLLVPSAALLPLAFAFLCGSGFAATQSLFPFFVGPAQEAGLDPVGVGTATSIGAAAGRTMSPVAAVTLMCGAMTDTPPLELTRRVAPPLLAGLAAMLASKLLLGW